MAQDNPDQPRLLSPNPPPGSRAVDSAECGMPWAVTWMGGPVHQRSCVNFEAVPKLSKFFELG